ncbi:hypothetical protein HME9302_02471 [Alteripontixanthobacter maritimus]|uniref:Uncharacterized protein n=1 Tax=Alteripontixanthobacter maritimus TaxID=2161824 RepID=A0A369QA77_9SPHN|nr:hypothetical protein [Alteripontixanthobacter maritimus]RDC61250.1 hypothetical protein HME9302_02471 [Alteripontixanthobacter maritimus]
MSFIERRRNLVSVDLLLIVGLAWLMICAVLLVTNIGPISAARFPDPDDTLRLVQVRDLLAGQSWFDLQQYRIDAAAGGVAMHWSRLVDIPLMLVIAALTPIIGQSAAEMTALVTVPLVTFGIALLLAGRIAWRLIGEEAAGFACLAMALSIPVISQLRPMRIDHHGWQIVFALLAVNGLVARNPALGGRLVGAALAFWMAISIEGLPLAAVICALAAFRWLRDRKDRVLFVNLVVSLAAVSVVLLLLTRGMAGLVNYCDAIGPAHVGIFMIGAAGAAFLSWMEPISRVALMTGFAAIGAAAFTVVWQVVPQCAGGGFAGMDPVVAGFWFDGVLEGMPIWHQTPALALQTIVPPLLGIAAAIKLARQNGGWLARWWLDYAILLVAGLLVAVFVTRAGAVAGALAAIPLGWQIAVWVRAARHVRKPGKRALALIAICLALLPTMPLTLLTVAIPASASSRLGTVPVQRVASCDIPRAGKFLRALPQGEILSPFDIGPRLLYETQHEVVATAHHRGQPGMRAAIDIFAGTPADARDRLAARGTDYIAICPDLIEPARYVEMAPNGLMAQLVSGDTPDWLEPLATARNNGMAIYRIRP